MVIYFKSVEKHTFDMPYIYFKLYNKIIVPTWTKLDPCPKRGGGRRFQAFKEGTGNMIIIP